MPATAKICGVTTPEAVDTAVGGGASHIGFVFFRASPRHLEFERAGGLAQTVPPHVGKVGVFVDPDDDWIAHAIAAAGLDALQLHKADAARRAAVRRRFGIAVWGVIEVRRAADLAALGHYDEADRILFDAKTPDGAALPGGMGLRFDWTLLRGVRPPLPWGLAGGLDADNVGEAIRVTGASLVDVSSGVESAPGVKDMDKIAAFLKAVSRS